MGMESLLTWDSAGQLFASQNPTLQRAWGAGGDAGFWDCLISSHRLHFCFHSPSISTKVLPVCPTFQRFDPAFQTTVSIAAELVKPAGVFITV